MLRSSPLSLPGSHLLFSIAILINIAIFTNVPHGQERATEAVFQFQYFTNPAMLNELGRSVFQVVILAGLVYLALRFRTQQTRTYSTLFALFGTQVLIALVFFVLAFAIPHLLFSDAVETSATGVTTFNLSNLPTPLTWLFFALILVWFGWWLLVIARILSHTMEISIGVGVFVTIVIYACQSLLTSIFF